MKLLEQYIYAIGKKLPYKSRNEIKMELKSAFLDELEAKYGKTHPKQISNPLLPLMELLEKLQVDTKQTMLLLAVAIQICFFS